MEEKDPCTGSNVNFLFVLVHIADPIFLGLRLVGWFGFGQKRIKVDKKSHGLKVETLKISVETSYYFPNFHKLWLDKDSLCYELQVSQPFKGET